MRRLTVLSTTLCALATLVLAGCGADRKYEAKPEPTVTVGQVMVNAGEFAGCKSEGESSFAAATLSRSFDCPNNARLGVSLVFHETEDAAKQNQADGWGTLQGATTLIKQAVSARPADQASLTIKDASGQFGKLGAPEEAIYCASYTGLGGVPRVTEYYGSYRYKKIVVQYSSWGDSGSCDGSSPSMENARALAAKQLEKLQASVP